MWADARAATLWGFIWLVAVTIAFLWVRRPPLTVAPAGRKAPSLAATGSWLSRVTWPVVALVALVVRLLPALWLPVGAGYDIESFRLVTDALLNGQEVYTSVLGRHPYLPLQMYIMGGATWLGELLGLPYVVSIKLPAVLADAVIAALITTSLSRDGRRPASAAAFGLLYALNPISLLVTSYHGQFEAITLLLLVLAWRSWRFGRHAAWSAGALGLAILNKTWPVILLPVFWIRQRSWRDRILYGVLAVGIPVAGIVFYLLVFDASPIPMLRRALTHRGVAGYWGPGALLDPLTAIYTAGRPLFDTLVTLRNVLLAGAALLALWLTRRDSALDAILTVILTVFVVTVGFGIQWLVWPVPFALLAREERWTKAYSVAGAFMLLVHLYGLHMYAWLGEWLSPGAANWLIRLSALPVWLVVVAWTISRYRQSQATRRSLAAAQEKLVE